MLTSAIDLRPQGHRVIYAQRKKNTADRNEFHFSMLNGDLSRGKGNICRTIVGEKWKIATEGSCETLLFHANTESSMWIAVMAVRWPG